MDCEQKIMSLCKNYDAGQQLPVLRYKKVCMAVFMRFTGDFPMLAIAVVLHVWSRSYIKMPKHAVTDRQTDKQTNIYTSIWNVSDLGGSYCHASCSAHQFMEAVMCPPQLLPECLQLPDVDPLTQLETGVCSQVKMARPVDILEYCSSCTY